MNVWEALQKASHQLQPKRITCAADKNLGFLEAEILLAYALNKDRVWLLANPIYELRNTSYERFDRLVRRRQKHEPIAYILGEKEFFGRSFRVTRNVLIPRPETEGLVELATSPLLTKERGRGEVFWDVGTGSGAIAVTLAAEMPNATILATDIDSKALAVARSNARRHGVAKRIHFMVANVLDAKVNQYLAAASRTHETLIVTANLPYLPMSDKKKLDPDVVKFEPSSALFCGRDGLDLIIKLLDQIALGMHAWKFKWIAIFVEFDPPQAKKLLRITKSTFLNAEIRVRKDLAGRERVLEVTSPLSSLPTSSASR